MQTLETPRLILRSWSILDLVDFFSYASDPEIGPAAGWKPHVTREDTWEALRHNIQADDGWAIALRDRAGNPVYFVAETSGRAPQPQGVEAAKIQCARAHFAAVSGGEVMCGAVRDLDELLRIVG